MPKSKKTKEVKEDESTFYKLDESASDPESAPEPPKKSTPKPTPKPQRIVALPPKVKKVSFDVWATRRNIRMQHRRGMFAFVTNPNLPRTVETWDSLFVDY